MSHSERLLDWVDKRFALRFEAVAEPVHRGLKSEYEKAIVLGMRNVRKELDFEGVRKWLGPGEPSIIRVFCAVDVCPGKTPSLGHRRYRHLLTGILESHPFSPPLSTLCIKQLVHRKIAGCDR